jgi:hypothetical protein
LHELVQELLGKALGVVETLEQKAAETLFDVLEERSGRDGQRQELPLGSENPLGEKRMDVWVPISAEGAKGLNRRHRAGSDIFAVKSFWKLLWMASKAVWERRLSRERSLSNRPRSAFGML